MAWTGLVSPRSGVELPGPGRFVDGRPLRHCRTRSIASSRKPCCVPALVLATLAAIIASQAVIRGRLACPAGDSIGLFAANAGVLHQRRDGPNLYAGHQLGAAGWVCWPVVLFFKSSSALASAYGIAVTLTMLITTVLTYFVVREGWRMPAPVAVGATAFFLCIDALLVAGCAIKTFDGGWFPLLLGLALFVLMSTWRRGRELLMECIRRDGLSMQEFIAQLDPRSMHRVGAHCGLRSGRPANVPKALLHNLKHNQVLHARNVILTVRFHEVPWIPRSDVWMCNRWSMVSGKCKSTTASWTLPTCPRRWR